MGYKSNEEDEALLKQMSDAELEAETEIWRAEDEERRRNTPIEVQEQYFLPRFEVSFSKFSARPEDLPELMRAATKWMEEQPKGTSFGPLSIEYGEPAGQYISLFFMPEIEPENALLLAAFKDTEQLLQKVADGEGNAEDFLRWMQSRMESYRWRIDGRPEGEVKK